MHSIIMAFMPWLTIQDSNAEEKPCLKFAEQHLQLHENKAELFGCHNAHHIWRSKALHITPKTPTLKFGGGTIRVGVCFSAYSSDTLHIIEGRMTGKMYQDILDNILHSRHHAYISKSEKVVIML